MNTKESICVYLFPREIILEIIFFCDWKTIVCWLRTCKDIHSHILHYIRHGRNRTRITPILHKEEDFPLNHVIFVRDPKLLYRFKPRHCIECLHAETFVQLPIEKREFIPHYLTLWIGYSHDSDILYAFQRATKKIWCLDLGNRRWLDCTLLIDVNLKYISCDTANGMLWIIIKNKNIATVKIPTIQELREAKDNQIFNLVHELRWTNDKRLISRSGLYYLSIKIHFMRHGKDIPVIDLIHCMENTNIITSDRITKRLYAVASSGGILYTKGDPRWFKSITQFKETSLFHLVGLMASPHTPHLYITFRDADQNTTLISVEDLSRLVRDEEVEHTLPNTHSAGKM